MGWYRFVDAMEKLEQLTKDGWSFKFSNEKVEVLYNTSHVRWISNSDELTAFIDDTYY
ncbi:hypothetical protein [Paenibacillus sp. NAIST15-1]|uniref:hypothetical protein n=1 Tax=Paenibacillus sp. NAIST15-1 TaxID=1605994 RepID=UPI00086A4FD7|nr:hypothetical protein [Paenibacillus sp. NAIST15-1]GAV11494.1 hypothetical protein PBN151_1423 [Paenibacillus sp. NAIST15-1]